jgi:hypothetical protein
MFDVQLAGAYPAIAIYDSALINFFTAALDGLVISLCIVPGQGDRAMTLRTKPLRYPDHFRAPAFRGRPRGRRAPSGAIASARAGTEMANEISPQTGHWPGLPTPAHSCRQDAQIVFVSMIGIANFTSNRLCLYGYLIFKTLFKPATLRPSSVSFLIWRSLFISFSEYIRSLFFLAGFSNPWRSYFRRVWGCIPTISEATDMV